MIQTLFVSLLRDAARAGEGDPLPDDHPAAFLRGRPAAEIRAELTDALRRLHTGALGPVRPRVGRATEELAVAFGLPRTAHAPRSALAALRPDSLGSMLRPAAGDRMQTTGVLARFFNDLRGVVQGVEHAGDAPCALEQAFTAFLSRSFAGALDAAREGAPASVRMPNTHLGEAADGYLTFSIRAGSALAAVDAFLSARRLPVMTVQTPAPLSAERRAALRAAAPEGTHVRFACDPRVDVPFRLFHAGRAIAARRA